MNYFIIWSKSYFRLLQRSMDVGILMETYRRGIVTALKMGINLIRMKLTSRNYTKVSVS